MAQHLVNVYITIKWIKTVKKTPKHTEFVLNNENIKTVTNLIITYILCT